MLNTCIRPEVSYNFAQRVVNRLTSEQLEKYGISSNSNKQNAIKAIADLAQSYIGSAESEEKQNQMLSDVDGFISDLNNFFMVTKVPEDKFEEVQKEYKDFIDTYSQYLGGRLGSAEFTASEEDFKMMHAVETVLSSLSDIASYRKSTKTDKDGQKVTTISWVIAEPIKEDKTRQQKVLDTIDNIKSIPSKYVDMEIAKDGDEKTVKYIKWSNESPEEGWHKTGRNRYSYNGQTILTQSVTPYEPNADYPLLGAPIGTHIDSVGRMFFDEDSELWKDGKLVSDDELQTIIDDNLGGIFTVEGLKNLINDFKELKAQLQHEWGKDIKFFTGDLRMFGKTNNKSESGEDIWNIGKPDLLVVDKDGIVHVLDFKSYKMTDIKGYQTFDHSRAEKYSEQVSSYIRILQSYGLNVDEHPYIIQVDTWYDSSDHGENNKNDKNNIYYYDQKHGNALGILEGKAGNSEDISLGEYAKQNPVTREEVLSDKLDKTILYMEPRLHLGYEKGKGFSSELNALRGGDNDKESGIKFHPELSYQQQWEALPEEDKKQMEWLFGKPVSLHTAQGIVTLSEKDIESRPDIISSQEIQDVADMLMYSVSRMITAMINGYSYPQIELSQPVKEGEKRTPLMGRKREEVIKLVGINNIIDLAFKTISDTYDEDFPSREAYKNGNFDDFFYEFEDDKDYERQRRMQEKSKWLIDHKQQLIVAGYQKLMSLENSIIPTRNKNTKKNESFSNNTPDANLPVDDSEVMDDTGDNEANQTFADMYLEGLTDVQAWMLNQRQFSPKASLAQEIRRMFEDLDLTDDDGEPVMDSYGWGFSLNVDPTMAIQTVYDKCKDCETIDEMISALNRLSKIPGNNWVNQLLAKINADSNLKKKFFRNFRKDTLLYSISEVKFDKKTGKRIVQTRIINTKSAYNTITQSLGASFNNGSVGKYSIKGIVKPIVSRSIDTGRNELVKIGDTTVADIIKRDIHKLEKAIRGIYNSKDYRLTKGKAARIEYVSKALQEKGSYHDDKSIIDGITEVLNGIGILVPQQVVLSSCLSKLSGEKTNNPRIMLEHAGKAITLLNIMDKSPEGIPSGLAGNKALHDYIPILQMIASDVQEYVEASVYQDGKTYYSFTNPSRLDHIIRNLKDALDDKDKFEKYLNDNFGRYTGWFKTVDGSEWLNDWVEQFANSRGAREALQHKTELTYIGTQYKNLGSLGFQLSILHNYFGSRDDQATNTRYRWFALPTMSNKPVNDFIRMYKYGNESSTIDMIKDEIIDKVLMKTFQQEMNRIADVLYHYTHNSIATDKMDITDHNLIKAGWSKDDIKGLQDRINSHNILATDLVRLSKIKSGAKFHFLWYLNNELANNTELAQKVTERLNLLLTPQEEKSTIDSSEEDTTTKMVRQAIADNMEKVVSAELEHMREIGLFDKETRTINGKKVQVLKYQDEFNGKLGSRKYESKEAGSSEREMENALTEFIWQDIAANINIIQITGGDLAYYGDAVNYQKRIAQEHSPGIHLMHDDNYDDGYFRSVHISDANVRNEIAENTRVALEGYLEENRTSMSPDAVEDYKKMITIIIKGLTDALVTDGQSFNSPTSIRKKLAMQGEWEDDMEKAYKSIKKGDFNINNLGIMLQPSKPFVTSDMAKYSGSTTMELRRTPLQDKNSEYLIILAEALQRGAKQKSKLVAICDFMEATADKHDKQGIDTVHFDSVNKVGKSGIIDINAFDAQYKGSDEDYNAALTKFMLGKVSRNSSDDTTLNDDERRSLDEQFSQEQSLVNNGTLNSKETLIYNNQYVDTIPVDDYIIQQEVPAHLLEHEQLFGSQIRILGISDITPGTTFQVYDENQKLHNMQDTDLINEYKELHAQNITEAYNDLMEELGLNSDDNSFESILDLPVGDERRNKVLNNLEFILQKELSKDAKYGLDVRRACTLQRDTMNNPIDFNVPLLDPIQSQRIQMLLNSIIKKTINKQKINGGPVVQTTAYDNDLHIRFKDKDGNILKTFSEYGKSLEEFRAYLKANQAGIAYFECYLPVPNVELERLMINEDGSMMSIDEVKKALPEEVWKSMSRIIGYRIPTEDKYSMLPLKVMGFVPKAAGQVIMMPQEITYLTGSDFDIDKMYLMLKSFDTKYGSVNDMSNTVIEAYVKELKDNGKNPFKGINATIRQLIDNGNKIISGRNNISWYMGIEKNNDTEALVKWYRNYLLKTLFVEYDRTDNDKKSAKKGRDNRILDLLWAVLTNEDTATKMLNPGGFDNMKKIGRIIRIRKAGIINPETGNPWTDAELHKSEMTADKLDTLLENSDPHNTTLPSSKIYFQHQNMQGSQMTGLIANNTVSHAFCSFQKIGIDLNKGSKNNTFAIDGHLIGNPDDPTVLDPLKGFNGQLISKTIATCLACVLDTAKDPVASDFNLNTFTGNVAMTMARLGFDIETIGYFLSQPVIVELSDLFYKNSTGGYYSGDSAFKEMSSILGIKDKELLDTEGIRNEDVLTKENLFDNMENSDYKDDTDSPEFEFQKRVLQAFYRLYQMAKNVQDLTFCTKFNSVTNAGGPTIADTMEDYDRVERFNDSVRESCFYEPRGDADNGFTDVDNVIYNDPILKAFYTSTIGEDSASETIFKNFFPHYFKGFQNVKSVFQSEFMGKKKITSKLYNQLLNDYLYYLLTYSDDNFAPTLPSDRKAQERLVGGLVKQFQDVVSIKGRKSNMLLDQSIGGNCLRVRPKDEFLAKDILIFNSGQLNSDAQQKIRNAWSDLITMQDPNLSDEDNERIRRFGVDLFFYTLMRNGFGFSPKTLMHLASVIVRYNATYSNGYNNYIVGLRNLKNVDNFLMGDLNSLVNIRRFIRQFIRNHSNNRTLVPNIDAQSSIIDYNNTESDSIVFETPEDESYKLDNLIMKENSPYKFITVTAKAGNKLFRQLYTLEPVGGSDIYYETENGTKMMKIKFRVAQSLGLANNFIEYNANDDLETSYFDDIRNESADSIEDEDTPKQQEGDEIRESQESVDDSDSTIGETQKYYLTKAMKSLEGPQHGKEGKDYRKALIQSIKEASPESELLKSALSLIDENTKDDKKQSLMDKINKVYQQQNKCK